MNINTNSTEYNQTIDIARRVSYHAEMLYDLFLTKGKKISLSEKDIKQLTRKTAEVKRLTEEILIKLAGDEILEAIDDLLLKIFKPKNKKMLILSYNQALHLVKMENTQSEALEMIAILASRKQISEKIEQQLQDWVKNNNVR
jgi:hypothetical protein